jgi:hypothetical protein
MLKTGANPEGLSLEVFDGIRTAIAKDRSQFYKDLAAPFYGANRPGAKVSQGTQDQFWLWSMQAGLKNAYESIKAFSETDFTEDLEKFDVPSLVMHGERDPRQSRTRRSAMPVAAPPQPDADHVRRVIGLPSSPVSERCGQPSATATRTWPLLTASRLRLVLDPTPASRATQGPPTSGWPDAREATSLGFADGVRVPILRAGTSKGGRSD